MPPAALLLLTLAQAPAPPTQLWAGHMVVHGVREVPILGRLDPRTDTYVLASVVPREGGYDLVQRPCRTTIAPVAGVRVGFRPDTDARLPEAHLSFRPGEGGLVAPGWDTGWAEEDLDQDSQPGVTVLVDAPLCGGELYVASQTRSSATARESDGGLVGELDVTVAQTILGADGACLKLVASDGEHRMRGRFAYAPVPAGTTCADAIWPAVEQ